MRNISIGFLFLFSLFSSMELSFAVSEQQILDRNGLNIMGRYRGLYEDAANLENWCNQDVRTLYPNFTDEEQVKRNFVSSLQLIGLNRLIPAIAESAHLLSYSKDDFDKLSTKLIGGFCSKNLSLYSHKRMKELFDQAFEMEPKRASREVLKSSSFPKIFNEITNEDEKDEKEFLARIELFKSFCSWGNSNQHYRLLIPYLSNPVIFSYVITSVTGQKYDWDMMGNRTYKSSFPESEKARCDGFMCRVDSSKKALWPKAVGSISLENDLQRLYCHKFRYLRLKEDPSSKKISKWIEESSYEQRTLLIGHFISLLTDVPEFMIWLDNYGDYKKLAMGSFVEYWNKDSKNRLVRLSQSLYYEEVLEMETVQSSYYFNDSSKSLGLHVDVNMGEFDKTTFIEGKESFVHTINLSLELYQWIRGEFLKGASIPMRSRLQKIVEKEMKFKFSKKLSLIGFDKWPEGLEVSLAKELLWQFETMKPFQEAHFIKDKQVPVKLSLNFSPNALQYLGQKYKYQ